LANLDVPSVRTPERLYPIPVTIEKVSRPMPDSLTSSTSMLKSVTTPLTLAVPERTAELPICANWVALADQVLVQRLVVDVALSKDLAAVARGRQPERHSRRRTGAHRVLDLPAALCLARCVQRGDAVASVEELSEGPEQRPSGRTPHMLPAEATGWAAWAAHVRPWVSICS
jgi:hypothetical protein